MQKMKEKYSTLELQNISGKQDTIQDASEKYKTMFYI